MIRRYNNLLPEQKQSVCVIVGWICFLLVAAIVVNLIKIGPLVWSYLFLS